MAIPSSRSIYTNGALMVRRRSGQNRAKMMRQPDRRGGRPNGLLDVQAAGGGLRRAGLRLRRKSGKLAHLRCLDTDAL